MNPYELLPLLFVLNCAVAVVVWLQQANRRDPDAREASPLAWFLIVFLFGLLGLLLYVAVGPKRGPILRPITDDEIEAWEEKR